MTPPTLRQVLKTIREDSRLNLPRQEDLGKHLWPEMNLRTAQSKVVRIEKGLESAEFYWQMFWNLLPLVAQLNIEGLPSPCKHKKEQPKDEPAPEAPRLLTGKHLIETIRRLFTNEERRRFDNLLRLAGERGSFSPEEIGVSVSTEKRRKRG